MATGSTLGAPRICITLKATGAIEKIYAVEAGQTVFGTVVLHHWDERTGVRLQPLPGRFVIHPEHQEHIFTLSNSVAVHENVFVLSDGAEGERTDPPAAYYTVRLQNTGTEEACLGSYVFCQLRGTTSQRIVSDYDAGRCAFVVRNEGEDNACARVFGISIQPTSYETTIDHAKAVSARTPGPLSCKTGENDGGDPMAVFHLSCKLGPGETLDFALTASFSIAGTAAAKSAYDSCPDAATALERTKAYYSRMLDRSVVMTPNENVNRGVLWAKANMLRTMLQAQTGRCFVNDPTRSNNSVGRDTAWFAFGADYLDPEFARESLLGYVERQEPSGMIVEYYDIRTGKTADYGLNVNDNTPLVVLALWHHYNATCDHEFLVKVYPAALKAARFLLSQRDKRGLVWCTATGTSDWGIVGWRNVIEGYRLSGATTELNSEAYAALHTVAQMARVLNDHDVSAELSHEATALRDAINTHLYNEANGLYYLNIDVDGQARSDVTSDLVFPVMFGVATDETAARIVSRLSSDDFWTEAGIRTVPRDALAYGPTHGYGLLGGVWVGVTFWYAFAAARFNSEFMADALSRSFLHYSENPGKNNTVPGQFSEWLHGETLVNQGMMLSPWFPPRYLWAAIAGAAGLDLSHGAPTVTPRLAPDWKWLGVRNLPYADRTLTWFTVRTPELRLYSNYAFDQSSPYLAYDRDVSETLHLGGHAATSIGLRKGNNLVAFVGNTVERTVATSLRIDDDLQGSYRMRTFNSLRGAWIDGGAVSADQLANGIALELERRGFWVIELEQET